MTVESGRGGSSRSAVEALLEPVTVGELELANRIVLAPMTRSRADGAGCLPGYAADYYAQRADAGLLISEATNVSAQAIGYAFTPGIWSERQVEAWRPVVAAVHARGGRFLLQLWHTGRLSHPDLHGGERPVAPSAVRPEGRAFTRDGMKEMVTPRSLETEEVAAIVEDYRRAAANAEDAGFDGVEIHSANNYLLEQFLRDSTNRRGDEYGGSLENRLRFPLAVAAAVVEVWGPGRVGVRISPGTRMPGETPLDSDPMSTYGTYLDRLAELGLAYTHVMEGTLRETREWPAEVDPDDLHRRRSGAYIANNRLEPAEAAGLIESGKADLASFGRAFIANPDLVGRIRDGAPLAEAPRHYWYGGTETGYSDWPTATDDPTGDRIR